MLSFSIARQLQTAGLAWQPAPLDYFAIPMPGFEDQVFVINNMTIMAEPIRGRLAITFHGTVEWALDHLWVGEVVWLPREDQLRDMLEERLLGEFQPALTFSTPELGYRCDIRFQGRKLSFDGFGAAETYAAALLYILEQG